MGVGMLEVSRGQFVDGGIGPWGRTGRLGTTTGRQPLRDEPIIFRPALGSTVSAEIIMATAERHDRPA
jgi:hypothetical protein